MKEEKHIWSNKIELSVPSSRNYKEFHTTYWFRKCRICGYEDWEGKK